MGCDGALGTEGDCLPLARFTDPYPWPRQVVPESLVVLCESSELELGHGLLRWTTAHDGREGCRTGAGRAEEEEKGEKAGDGANGTKGVDQGRPSLEVQTNGDGKSPAGPLSPTNGSAPATPAAEVGGLDPTAKKIRNLTKKVTFS